MVATHRHNMLSILDRLIVIDGGKILADGPRDEVLKHLTAAAAADSAPAKSKLTRAALTARRFAAVRGLRIERWRSSHWRWSSRATCQPAPGARRGRCVDRDHADHPAKAAQLIEATTGDAAKQMQAVGEQAKLINAALPFASGPLHAARPFAVGGSELDQRRALLCLTQAVYYEAGFEPLEGRRAVAQVVLNRMRHPAFPKSVCGVVYQGTTAASASSPSSATARCIARPRSARWRAGRADRPRRARRLCRDAGRRSHPLSCRLCRAALGAVAGQGRADRAAHLLSLAGRLGTARGLHRPLHRRAARSALDASAAAGASPARRAIRRWPGRRRPVRQRAPQRRRRVARYVQGLDAQHSRSRTTATAPQRSWWRRKSTSQRSRRRLLPPARRPPSPAASRLE